MQLLISIILLISNYTLEAQTCDEMYLPKLESEIEEISSNIGHQGIRIISYNDSGVKCSFIVGIASTTISAGKSSSILARITSVKIKREILLFVQGSTVTSETIFKTEQEISNDEVLYYETMIDKISENSSGFVEGMKSLKNFKAENGKLFVNSQYNIISE